MVSTAQIKGRNAVAAGGGGGDETIVVDQRIRSRGQIQFTSWGWSSPTGGWLLLLPRWSAAAEGSAAVVGRPVPWLRSSRRSPPPPLPSSTPAELLLLLVSSPKSPSSAVGGSCASAGAALTGGDRGGPRRRAATGWGGQVGYLYLLKQAWETG